MTEPHLLGGRYALGETIGVGGMAEVFRGNDIRLGRDVAVKVLRADLARDPSFQMRFRREAQAAASLNHSAIVAVYDTGEQSTIPYIVMEYVEGRTLRDILQTEGRLLPQRALEVAADICAALDVAHGAGIVHRDIKPANVMLTPRGEVKVMDFGIARAVADASSTVTRLSALPIDHAKPALVASAWKKNARNNRCHRDSPGARYRRRSHHRAEVDPQDD